MKSSYKHIPTLNDLINDIEEMLISLIGMGESIGLGKFTCKMLQTTGGHTHTISYREDSR